MKRIAFQGIGTMKRASCWGICDEEDCFPGDQHHEEDILSGGSAMKRIYWRGSAP
jgi:hypothetical protein